MRGAAMGTRWSVKIADAKLTPEQEQAVANSIATRLGRIESLMSTWDSSSEISRFNLHAPNEMFEISRELRQVFEISREVHQLSDGAFDVTVGPLVGLWGFGSGARREEEGVRRLPSGSELEATRARVGLAKVGLDPVGQLYKTLEGVELDFSGIAKGYAVDRVAEGLLELGYRAFLFELGGELRGHGGHRDGSSWRVAIEVPRSAGRAVHRVVELVDAAMATSGDYRNFYERGGKRFSHTIDPRSGRPVEHALASVTVVHPDAARADALATALNVLGPAEGLALARAAGIRAYFMARAGANFEVSMTESFEELLVE
jgi:thiamine biosynthesis lipoprotein